MYEVTTDRSWREAGNEASAARILRWQALQSFAKLLREVRG